MQTVVDGIRDEEIRHALLLVRPTTLIRAVGTALEFEVAKKASREEVQVLAVKEKGKTGNRWQYLLRQV